MVIMHSLKISEFSGIQGFESSRKTEGMGASKYFKLEIVANVEKRQKV